MSKRKYGQRKFMFKMRAHAKRGAQEREAKKRETAKKLEEIDAWLKEK